MNNVGFYIEDGGGVERIIERGNSKVEHTRPVILYWVIPEITLSNSRIYRLRVTLKFENK